MNWKDFLLRLAGFVVIAVAAMPVFALTINALVLFSLIPPTLMESGFGNIVTMKAVFVWAGCLLTGFGGIFIKEKWGLILYLSPMYAPALFAVVFTLIQKPA